MSSPQKVSHFIELPMQEKEGYEKFSDMEKDTMCNI